MNCSARNFGFFRCTDPSGIAIAQRQIGETALNEMSSRSHQILRLVGSHATLNLCIFTLILHQIIFFSAYLNLLETKRLGCCCYAPIVMCGLQTIESLPKQIMGRGNSSTLLACVVRISLLCLLIKLFSWYIVLSNDLSNVSSLSG
jgi:hypothetical protein